MDDLEVALQGDDHQTELSDNYSKDRLLGRKPILRLLISHTEESKGGQVFFRFHTEHLVRIYRRTLVFKNHIHRLRISACNHCQTELSGIHAHDRQRAVAKDEADEVVADVAEPRIARRRTGKRHADADHEENAREQIHGGLVGDERVDAAAEKPTREHQNHEDDGVRARATDARHDGHDQRRHRQRRTLRKLRISLRCVLDALARRKLQLFAGVGHRGLEVLRFAVDKF